MTLAKYDDGDWRKPERAKRTDLTEQQEAFLDWLTDPEIQSRSPKPSQNSYAAEVGVHKGTLVKWKRDPLFVKAWEARLASMNVNPERVQDLMEVLFVQGKEGNVKAIELYMRLNDRLTPERHIVAAEMRPAEMTDDQLALELERRAAGLRGIGA